LWWNPVFSFSLIPSSSLSGSPKMHTLRKTSSLFSGRSWRSHLTPRRFVRVGPTKALLAADSPSIAKEAVDPYAYAGKTQLEPYYITTPIYYVNGMPHLGHAYTSVSADVISRFHRKDGREVYFLTGTDEHGQKVQQSAHKAGVEPQKYVDEVSKVFQNISKSLGCTPDRFIRTTEEQHQRTVQALWKLLEDRGQIYLGAYEGWYSVRDEAFYGEAELVDGKAPSGAQVEWVKEESYFFRLSQWVEPLLEYYQQNPDFVQPRAKVNELVAFLTQSGGIRDLSISRTTFTWGVPVPGNDKHVVYVWLDALANYLTAVGWPDHNPSDFSKFWPANVHIVGKDILRFHAGTHSNL
jgi:methionyl-tRNA synthetase